MKNKISLQQIVNAIKKNCVIDTLSPKPITLKKSKGVKSKSLGRLLCIYLADRHGVDRQDVIDYLELTEERYILGWRKINELLERGRELFESRTGELNDPSLYFYRKLRIIESALGLGN